MHEPFAHYLHTNYGHLKYARGKPAVNGQEFHDYHEIILFLEGNSRLISKNIQYDLLPGSMVFIPKEHFHQFIVSQEDSYLRCILGFRDIPQSQSLIADIMTDVLVIPQPSDAALCVFRTLMQAAGSDLTHEEKTALFLSSVTQLLIDFKLSEYPSIQSCIDASPLTLKVLSYISGHISSPELTLEKIARALNASVSSVSHHFRRDLSISVYRYITEKRLSNVRKHTSNGMTLSAAAALSGFKDYSSFFRLYKSYYGQSPSGNAKR